MKYAKPDYGIDAPNVIRNLLLIGTAAVLLGIYLSSVIVIGWGATFFVSPILMILYARSGKFYLRERLLNKVAWTGAESVLDVGTGRGLLMIGAAKRLKSGSGKATGIDIWNSQDLTNNRIENTLRNASLEGVAQKTEVKGEDARKMSFPDRSFDVVVSNLCLHNIYDTQGRAKACAEIIRVLKPGGMAIVCDFRHTRQYADIFRSAGLSVTSEKLPWWKAFPPLQVVTASVPTP